MGNDNKTSHQVVHVVKWMADLKTDLKWPFDSNYSWQRRSEKKCSKEKEMCSCVRKRSSIEYDDRLTFTSIIYRSKDYAYVWRRHQKVNCIGHFILNFKSDHRFFCQRKHLSLSVCCFLSLWWQQLLLICVKNIAQLKWNLALTYGTKRWHSLHCLFRTIAHTQSSLRFDEDCLKTERQPPWFVKVSALESRCNAYGNRNPYALQGPS